MSANSEPTSHPGGLPTGLLALGAGIGTFIVCSIVQAAGGSSMFEMRFEEPDNFILQLLMQLTWWPGWIATVLFGGGGLLLIILTLFDDKS